MRSGLILGILLIFGCKSVETTNSNACKNGSLQIEIVNNWKISTDSTYYLTNEVFYKSLENKYRDCITNLEENELITIFGTQYETGTIKSDSTIKSTLKYFITPPCKDQNSQCGYLIFYISLNGKVKSFSEIYSDPNIIK